MQLQCEWKQAMMLEDKDLHVSPMHVGTKSSAGVWIILTYSENMK